VSVLGYADPASAAVSALMTPGDIVDAEIVIGRPEWHKYAACRGGGTLRWFPGLGDSTSAGRAICGECMVRFECLDYALADPALQGVWGGTSDRERAAMRRSTA
jgi:WhiB family redox-sensing transcriptional regulator